MTSDLLADRDLALELHRLLSDIDPVRWREDKAATITPKLRELHRNIERRPNYAELAKTLGAELPTLGEEKSTWLAFKERIQAPYMELAKKLQAASIHVPSLRPTNYARNLMHVSSAVGATVAIALLPAQALIGIAVAWATFAWSCELARRLNPRINTLLMKAFGRVAHQHESYRVNSATWYATALVVLSLTHLPVLCLAGVAVLGVGDPVAALVGRRFGRTQLLHGRSLEGTLAFVVSATVATLGVFALLQPQLGLGVAVLLALGAAVAGAIAELVSLRVDDNFSIPLSAAAGLGLVATLLHVAL